MKYDRSQFVILVGERCIDSDLHIELLNGLVSVAHDVYNVSAVQCVS